MVTGAEAQREIGLKQCKLELVRAAFEAGPMQQPMGIECVVYPAVFRRESNGEAELGCSIPDRRSPFLKLLKGGPVLLRDMLNEVLTLGRHVRIELERLEANVGFDEAAEPLQRALEPSQANDTPWARNVGHEINLQGRGHRSAYIGSRIRRRTLDYFGFGEIGFAMRRRRRPN